MVKNDISFVLSFVILMVKIWIFGFSPRVCPMGPCNLVSSFGCLVSNGRWALLVGIRLGSSATERDLTRSCIHMRSVVTQLCVTRNAAHGGFVQGSKRSPESGRSQKLSGHTIVLTMCWHWSIDSWHLPSLPSGWWEFCRENPTWRWGQLSGPLRHCMEVMW